MILHDARPKRNNAICDGYFALRVRCMLDAELLPSEPLFLNTVNGARRSHVAGHDRDTDGWSGAGMPESYSYIRD